MIRTKIVVASFRRSLSRTPIREPESSRSCKKTDQLDFLSILRLLDAGSVMPVPDCVRDDGSG
ncbi:MAG: hypothetical protein R6V20_09815, partial [Desulfobia sp.]